MPPEEQGKPSKSGEQAANQSYSEEYLVVKFLQRLDLRDRQFGIHIPYGIPNRAGKCVRLRHCAHQYQRDADGDLRLWEIDDGLPVRFDVDEEVLSNVAGHADDLP